MKKHLFIVLTLFGMLHLNGCMSIRSPFEDIYKLGTVIQPEGHITLQSEIGPVTIEYAAPTKRRLLWKGESREFSLMKSKQLNGIYGGPMRLKTGPIGNVYGVSYSESTKTFFTKKEYKDHVSTYVDGYGFEHREKEQLIVRCAVSEGRKKYLYIGIEKYRFADEL